MKEPMKKADGAFCHSSQQRYHELEFPSNGLEKESEWFGEKACALLTATEMWGEEEFREAENLRHCVR